MGFDWLLGVKKLVRKAPKIVTGTIEKAQNEVYTHAEGVGVFQDYGDVGKQLLGNVQRQLLPLPFPLPRNNTGPWHVIKSKKNARARISAEREEDGSDSLRIDYVPGEVGMCRCHVSRLFCQIAHSLIRCCVPRYELRMGVPRDAGARVSVNFEQAELSGLFSGGFRLEAGGQAARALHRAPRGDRWQLGVQGGVGAGGVAAERGCGVVSVPAAAGGI